MEYTFVTITEAARLTGQNDLAIMRAIKDYLEQPGVQSGDILRKEPRENDFIYLVNKEVLFQELKKTKDAPQSETPQKPESSEILEAKNEMIATLQKVVDTQDRQIEDLSKKIDQLIERDGETNILLKNLQDKIFLLEQGRPPASQRGETKKQA